MNVAHILLGQPWIEHLDVDHEEGDSYSFIHGDYVVKLLCYKSREKVKLFQ